MLTLYYPTHNEKSTVCQIVYLVHIMEKPKEESRTSFRRAKSDIRTNPK
jgi:hypothetical protein